TTLRRARAARRNEDRGAGPEWQGRHARFRYPDPGRRPCHRAGGVHPPAGGGGDPGRLREAPAVSVDGLRWQPPQATARSQGMRPVLFLVGQVLLAASAFMLLPLAVDLHAGHRDWTSFAMATCVAALVGAGLAW